MKEIQDWTCRWIAINLNCNLSEVEPTESFTYYGLDSVNAISFVDELNKAFGKAIGPESLYDFATIGEFASYAAEN